MAFKYSDLRLTLKNTFSGLYGKVIKNLKTFSLSKIFLTLYCFKLILFLIFDKRFML